uniref:Uncharacterized protein n=1 Tax=Homalodisca liturata TaxID=320908 RepID=A0A1B6IWZ5_9HEMI
MVILQLLVVGVHIDPVIHLQCLSKSILDGRLNKSGSLPHILQHVTPHSKLTRCHNLLGKVGFTKFINCDGFQQVYFNCTKSTQFLMTQHCYKQAAYEGVRLSPIYAPGQIYVPLDKCSSTVAT